ncbi:MAG: response regulator transcription factor [Clostridia bacterium]|nr:response regulator transcription factor [Clostridia bacterium]
MKQLIYAVEDDPSIQELYVYTIESAGFDVECFECGADMFKRLSERMPDLFILDIMLDGMNGYEILSKLKAENKLKDIPVIMVSAKGEEISKVKGLNLGADDYISKPFGVLELVARINANLRKHPIDTVRNVFKDVVIDDNTHKILIRNNEVSCTLKEYNLLKMLVENAEKVIFRDVILNNVWGTDFFGETRTLDMHITSLRKILNENKSEVVIETVRGVGYILK